MGYMPQRVHEPDAVLERVAETCEACGQTATGRDIKNGDSGKTAVHESKESAEPVQCAEAAPMFDSWGFRQMDGEME